MFIPCKFCGTEKKELYKCPRCESNYCSVKCYRSKEHADCSEGFYKDCVRNQLQGKRFEGDNKNIDTFEERMEQFLKGESDEMPGTSDTKEEEGEPLGFDSDEENPEDDYMKKVLEDTVDDYVMDDAELERKLLAMGLGADVEQLLAALNPDEKEAFEQLAENIYQSENGLGQSCFKRK